MSYRERGAPPPVAPRSNLPGRRLPGPTLDSRRAVPGQDYNDNCSGAGGTGRTLDNRRSSRAGMGRPLDRENNIQAECEGPGDRQVVSDVGISCLTKQIRRRAISRGFSLNLMVVGEAGLGKSTLINSMFLSTVYTSQGIRAEKTARLEPHRALLQEGGVSLNLTVVDTPGFGDIINNTNCWQPITGYLEEQFSQFLEAETRVERGPTRADRRVHGLLYFLPPTGHGLRAVDIETMRRLQDKVNIIPVIGKADAFTREELEDFKLKVRSQLVESRIVTYQFPSTGGGQGGQCGGPWAVVGSNTVLEQGGQRLWGRRYPWGTVSIEDPEHCDFSLLRSLLLARHTLDLVDRTHNLHYETFRCRELSSLAAIDEGKPTIPNKNPLAVIEDETRLHRDKVTKMEEEMEEVFRKKVEEKKARHRRGERDMEESGVREMGLLEEERREVARRREQLRREVEQWEAGLDTVSDKSMDSLGKRRFGFGTLSKIKFGGKT